MNGRGQIHRDNTECHAVENDKDSAMIVFRTQINSPHFLLEIHFS